MITLTSLCNISHGETDQDVSRMYKYNFFYSEDEMSEAHNSNKDKGRNILKNRTRAHLTVISVLDAVIS